MGEQSYQIDLSLDEFRPLLEDAAREAGVVLDFLMRAWNGRFATYNIGRETAEGADARRGVRDEARRYRLIGRLKGNSRAGALHLVLTPPTLCDPAPTPQDEQLWAGFLQALHRRIGRDG